MSKFIVRVKQKTDVKELLPLYDGCIVWEGYIEAESQDDAKEYAIELFLNALKARLQATAEPLPYYIAPRMTRTGGK